MRQAKLRALYLKIMTLCKGKARGDIVVLELTGEEVAGILMALEVAGEL